MQGLRHSLLLKVPRTAYTQAGAAARCTAGTAGTAGTRTACHHTANAQQGGEGLGGGGGGGGGMVCARSAGGQAVAALAVFEQELRFTRVGVVLVAGSCAISLVVALSTQLKGRFSPPFSPPSAFVPT